MRRLIDHLRNGLRHVPPAPIIVTAGAFLLAAIITVWWDKLLASLLALEGSAYAVWAWHALKRVVVQLAGQLVQVIVTAYRWHTCQQASQLLNVLRQQVCAAHCLAHRRPLDAHTGPSGRPGVVYLS